MTQWQGFRASCEGGGPDVSEVRRRETVAHGRCSAGVETLLDHERLWNAGTSKDAILGAEMRSGVAQVQRRKLQPRPVLCREAAPVAPSPYLRLSW